MVASKLHQMGIRVASQGEEGGISFGIRNFGYFSWRRDRVKNQAAGDKAFFQRGILTRNESETNK
jgi:hypothetical protein